MQIEQILDELSTCGRRKTPRIIWETALYYYGSILMNKYNYRKDTGSRAFVRYYSIVFANSAVGKSFALNTIEKLCGLENYGAAMKQFYDQSLAMLPEEPESIDEIYRYMPKSVTIGVEGTSEGLFYVAQSQRESNFGSLNLSTEEFGETIASSGGLLLKLKELYDGKFKAKVIKGDADSEMKSDIDNIICNFIGLGSRKGVTADSEKELKRIASSGMYRRTFIVESKETVEKNRIETNTEKTKEYLHQLNENCKHDFRERRKLDPLSEKFMTHTKEYEIALEEIDDDLVDRAQNDKLNEFAQYNTGSLEMIIDLSYIIAFLEWDTEVTERHLKKAYDFMVRTRDSVEDTFKSIHPYKLMYDLLSLKDNMTVSEMAEIEGNIPTAKSKILDAVALLEEVCYRKDEVLIKTEGKVTRYRIEELPKTNMNKLIVSMCGDKRYEKAINFSPHEVSWEQMEKLVLSEKQDSFTTCHYQSSTSAPDGHRKADNFIEGQNLIVFDIDAGMEITEAQELLADFTYLMYTTKSHQKEKAGVMQGDRFRIVLPVKTMFYVSPEQHKQMYENIEELLNITSNDTATRNVSRLFYTNSTAQIFKNDGELLDVSSCIPSTIKSDKFMPIIHDVNEQMEEGEMSRREAGYIKYFLATVSTGDRHNSLTKAYYFFRDLGVDPDSRVARLNAMLADPMTDAEMKYIYSIGRRN